MTAERPSSDRLFANPERHRMQPVIGTPSRRLRVADRRPRAHGVPLRHHDHGAVFRLAPRAMRVADLQPRELRVKLFGRIGAVARHVADRETDRFGLA